MILIQFDIAGDNMSAADNLKDILQKQREALAELEAEYRKIAESDLSVENDKLRGELERNRVAIERLEKNADALAKENNGLKNTLHEQMFNDKVKILNTSSEKIEAYFKAGIDQERNRLNDLELRVKERINSFNMALSRNNIAAEDEIHEKLNELNTLLTSKIAEANRNLPPVPGAFTADERAELEALKNEDITDDQIFEVTRKNNIERFLGLNVLNALGVLLLIIGSITLAHFTYFRLTNLLKGVMLFGLGGLMLALGEFLNSKRANVFSLGISAGGVGVLYTALALSFFALGILDMYPALLICVLITTVAFVLSNRYNAQIIAVFALVGGYLPLYSIGSDLIVLYGAMVYFVALNLLALLISFSKKWRISSFLGLFLNTIGTLYICGSYYRVSTTNEVVLNILYVLFAFLVYTAIPIVSTFRTGSRFRKSDIVLLAINTVFSTLIMFYVFYIHDLEDFHGLLAIGYAFIYLLIGKFIESKFSQEERYGKALFYLTGLAFVILTIPLQFGRSWLSLGWLAEGVLLAVYGILTGEKGIRRAGFVVCALCLFAFMGFDTLQFTDYMYVYKYSAITIGSIAIFTTFAYKGMLYEQFVKAYKYFVLGNFWIYLMYLIQVKIRSHVFSINIVTAFQLGYLLSAAAIVATFVLAYSISRISLLSDLGTKMMSITLYLIGIIGLAFINSYSSPVSSIYLRFGTQSMGTTIAGTAILLVLGALSIFALRDLILMILSERKLGIEWYPLIVSGYGVIILTQNLISQYNLSFSSAAISIIYVLTALGWIIFGFSRRYSFIRKFGLGLSIVSVAKLFLVDLASLTQGYQIVSYFSLGITLIAISFVYQFFNKRMENQQLASQETES